MSILHHIAHLLFGVGILAARKHRTALQHLLAAGVLYVVLFVYGLIASEKGSENFIPTNNGDDVLHAALALALVGSWAAAKKEEDPDLRGDRVVRDERAGSRTA